MCMREPGLDRVQTRQPPPARPHPAFLDFPLSRHAAFVSSERGCPWCEFFCERDDLVGGTSSSRATAGGAQSSRYLWGTRRGTLGCKARAIRRILNAA